MRPESGEQLESRELRYEGLGGGDVKEAEPQELRLMGRMGPDLRQPCVLFLEARGAPG